MVVGVEEWTTADDGRDERGRNASVAETMMTVQSQEGNPRYARVQYTDHVGNASRQLPSPK